MPKNTNNVNISIFKLIQTNIFKVLKTLSIYVIIIKNIILSIFTCTINNITNSIILLLKIKRRLLWDIKLL